MSKKIASIVVLAAIMGMLAIPLVPMPAPVRDRAAPGGIVASLPPTSSGGGYDFRWHTPSYPLVYPLNYMGGAAYNDFDAALDPYGHWANVTSSNATGPTRLTIVNASYGGDRHRALYLDWGPKVQGWETLDTYEGVNYTFPVAIPINNTMATQNFEFDFSVPNTYSNPAIIDVQHFLKFYNSSDVYPYELDMLGGRTIALMHEVDAGGTVNTNKIQSGGVDANYVLEVNHWYRFRVSFYNTTHYGLSIANYTGTGMAAWTVYDPVTWDGLWAGHTNTDVVRASFHRQSGTTWMVPTEMGASPEYYISNITYTNMTARHDAPIAITSDADWPVYCDSGSGTAIDPWIVENYDIECAAAGNGIDVTGTTDHAIFRDIAVNDSGAGGTDAAIYLHGIVDIDIDNATVPLAGNIGLLLFESGHVLVENLLVNVSVIAIYIEACWDAGIVDSELITSSGGWYIYAGIVLAGNGSTDILVDNVTFTDNTRESILATDSYVTAENCIFVANGANALLHQTGTGMIDVHDSTITNNTGFIVGIVVFDSNWYTDYFDVYPYANLVNSSTDVLDTPYSVTPGGNNDTHPRYLASAWPRADLVAVSIFNNVDGSSIFFGMFNVTVNGVHAPTTPIAAGFVLFHVVIEKGGTIYHNATYNVNSTGSALAIGIYYKTQIYLWYFSNLDGYGYEFSLTKTYINGTRVTTDSPWVDYGTIAIQIKDGFNVVLYSSTIDLSISSVYVDIGLNVTTVEAHNNFSFGVIFHYSIGGIEKSFPMTGGARQPLRVALGTYLWWITDELGHPVDGKAGYPTSDSKTVAGPGNIDFGWTDAAVTPGPVDPTNTYVIVLMLCAGFGAGIGIPMAWLGRAKQAAAVRKGKPKPRTHMKDH